MTDARGRGVTRATDTTPNRIEAAYRRSEAWRGQRADRLGELLALLRVHVRARGDHDGQQPPALPDQRARVLHEGRQPSLPLPRAFARLNPDKNGRDYGPRRRPPPEDLTLTQRIAFHGTGALAFSTKGEYGVRLMVQLARHFGSGPASLSAISADEDLPRAYLEQLAMSLRDAGLVISTRGARGGYELARPPADIHMGEVLRALEGPIAPMICATEDPEHALLCDRSAKCTVNVLWVRVRDAITGTLDAMTLADLAPRPLVHLEPGELPVARPDHDRNAPGSHFVTQSQPGDRELVIRGLRVAPAAKPDHEILQGIDLTVRKGEVHAIMGPNGSGKTTLAYALMGHPAYLVKGGEVRWKGYDLLSLSPDKRARLGLFLAFQYPTAIPGLSVASFIRSALNAKLQGIDKDPDVDPTDTTRGGVSMLDFRRRMREKMALLKMDEGFATRYVNEGFSGGEKKRLEMLQMAMLGPEMAILDETDSGLDIDALRIVAEGVNAQLSDELGVLLITHYQRLLNHITPDFVHVLAAGRIVTSGGKELALRLEEEGYGPILREAGLETGVSDEALHVPLAPGEVPGDLPVGAAAGR